VKAQPALFVFLNIFNLLDSIPLSARALLLLFVKTAQRMEAVFVAGRRRNGAVSGRSVKKEDTTVMLDGESRSCVQRKTRKRRIPGGEQEGHGTFFEVSKVVASPDMLRSWIKWFEGLNIPCAVARVPGGYTLWRRGEEIGRTRAKAGVLKRKDIVYSFGL
jgi:hypothetical protein